MAHKSIEEREARITEITARLTAIDAASTGDVLNETDQQEWNTLLAEKSDHEAAIKDIQDRKAVLMAAAQRPEATESPANVAERGAPAVIVKAGTARWAESLAKAALVAGVQAGVDLLHRHDVTGWVVDDEGRVWATGLARHHDGGRVAHGLGAVR